MTIIVTRPHEGAPIDLQILKTMLPYGSFPSEEILTSWIKVAVQWLENHLNQAFLTQHIQIISKNNRIPLLRVPFCNVIEVKQRGKILGAHEYTIGKNDAGLEELETPFHWKSPQTSVEYVAGYGETYDKVPMVLRQIIMHTVRNLCENRGDPNCLAKSVPAWLDSSCRSYRLF